MLAVVDDPLPAHRAAQHFEPLVEHLRPDARVAALPERGELLRDAADRRPEDHTAAAENVERRHLVGEHMDRGDVEPA